jgi:hypothetical protein
MHIPDVTGKYYGGHAGNPHSSSRDHEWKDGVMSRAFGGWDVMVARAEMSSGRIFPVAEHRHSPGRANASSSPVDLIVNEQASQRA